MKKIAYLLGFSLLTLCIVILTGILHRVSKVKPSS